MTTDYTITKMYIYFDTSDPENWGWAWSVEYTSCDDPDGYILSGPLPHRNKIIRLTTLRRSLAREFGGGALRQLAFPRSARSDSAWRHSMYGFTGWQWSAE